MLKKVIGLKISIMLLALFMACCATQLFRADAALADTTILTTGPGTVLHYNGSDYDLSGTVSLDDAWGMPDFLFFGVPGDSVSLTGSGVSINSSGASWSGGNGWPGVVLDKFFFGDAWDTSQGGMFTADVHVVLPGGGSFPVVINPDNGFTCPTWDPGSNNSAGSLRGSCTNPKSLTLPGLPVYAIVQKGETFVVPFDPLLTPWNYADALFADGTSAECDNLNFSLALIGTLDIIVPYPQGYRSVASADTAISARLFDRRNRVLFSYVNITNTDSEPIVGPARFVIFNNTIDVVDGPPGLSPDGYTDDGEPYFNFLADGEVLNPGEPTGNMRVNFALERKRLTYEVRVESLQDDEPEKVDIHGTLYIDGSPAVCTGYTIKIYNDEEGPIEGEFVTGENGRYSANQIPVGPVTFYVYDPEGEFISEAEGNVPDDVDIYLDICHLHGSVTFYTGNPGDYLLRISGNGVWKYDWDLSDGFDFGFLQKSNDPYDIELINWDWVTIQTWEVPLPCDGQGGEDWSCSCNVDECNICTCDVELQAGSAGGDAFVQLGGLCCMEEQGGWTIELAGSEGTYTIDAWMFEKMSLPAGFYTVTVFDPFGYPVWIYEEVNIMASCEGECWDTYYNSNPGFECGVLEVWFGVEYMCDDDCDMVNWLDFWDCWCGCGEEPM